MANRVDHTGEKYGRLTVEQFDRRGNSRESYWRCRCECGGTTSVAWGNLRSGDIKSCGCLHDEVAGASRRRHGLSGTRTHQIWKAMRKRCRNPNGEKWARYGGRGISVCDRWMSFENFLADMGEAPDGLSIDRINNDGNYEPGNCRWATPKQQGNNTARNVYLEIDGVKEPLQMVAARYGRCAQSVKYRLRRGMSLEEAIASAVVVDSCVQYPTSSYEINQD